MIATIIGTALVAIFLYIAPSEAVKAYQEKQKQQAEKPVEQNRTEK